MILVNPQPCCPTDAAASPLIQHFAKLAAELSVVLPVSFFERSNNAHFNSVVVIDADGTVLPGVYRKSHIPDGPGYQEKFYFSPGDTGAQGIFGMMLVAAFAWQ